MYSTKPKKGSTYKILSSATNLTGKFHPNNINILKCQPTTANSTTTTTTSNKRIKRDELETNQQQEDQQEEQYQKCLSTLKYESDSLSLLFTSCSENNLLSTQEWFIVNVSCLGFVLVFATIIILMFYFVSPFRKFVLGEEGFETYEMQQKFNRSEMRRTSSSTNYQIERT